MRERITLWAIVAIFGAILGLAGYGLVAMAQPVQAKSQLQEPGTCVQFAEAGSWAQYHCVDPSGNEYNASDSGMMISVGN